MNYELEMARFNAAEAERKLNEMRFQQRLAQKSTNDQYQRDSDRVDQAQMIAETILQQADTLLNNKNNQEKRIAELKSNITKLQAQVDQLPSPNTPINNSKDEETLAHQQNILNEITKEEQQLAQKYAECNTQPLYKDITIDADLAANTGLTAAIADTIAGGKYALPYTKDTPMEDIERINTQKYNLLYDLYLQEHDVPPNDSKYKDYAGLIAHQESNKKRGIFRRLFG